MDGWTELTVARVEAGMATDMAVLYPTWVDGNPAKAGRLSALVAETVASFREAVGTQAGVSVPDDTTLIPMTGFRHAMNLVLFTLGMEMGVDFAPEVYSLNVQANVWLRMVQAGKVKAVAEAAAAEGTPSYGVRETTDYGRQTMG